MPLDPGLCARCKSNIRLSYHPYCRECKAEYAREHPQKYIPHPLPKKTWEQCFWTKVNKTDNCWLWTGAVDRRGYASFKVGNIVTDPGRFLHEQLHGVIPDGLVLYRTCKIRCCVNPAHLTIGDRTKPLTDFKERFFGRINHNGPVPIKQPQLGACWIWTGRITPYGYGAFYFEGKDRPAHRVSWIIHNGAIASGEIDVCHKCDVAACVRPDHLFLGTAFQNIMDCAAKGRAIHPRGEQAGKAKLSERQEFLR